MYGGKSPYLVTVTMLPFFFLSDADAVSPTYNTDYIRNSTSGNGNIVSVTKHTHRYRFRSPLFQVRFTSVSGPFQVRCKSVVSPL